MQQTVLLSWINYEEKCRFYLTLYFYRCIPLMHCSYKLLLMVPSLVHLKININLYLYLNMDLQESLISSNTITNIHQCCCSIGLLLQMNKYFVNITFKELPGCPTSENALTAEHKSTKISIKLITIKTSGICFHRGWVININ